MEQIKVTRSLGDSHVSDFKIKVNAILSNLNVPTRSDEAWRKFPINQIDMESILAKGVVVDKVEDRLSDQENKVVQQILATLLGSIKDDYFALLALSQATKYQFIYIDEKNQRDELLEIDFNLSGDQNQSLVNLVYVAPNCKQKLRETLGSLPIEGKSRFFNSLSFYFVSQNSFLDVLTTEDFDEDSTRVRFVCSHQESDSGLSIYPFFFRGFRGKTFYHSILKGNGSEYLLTGVSALSKREFLDIDAKVTHLRDFTTSRIQYKAIVSDRSHHVFTGNLSIPNSVKKANAHQESQNLSLNKKARAEANPKLEVMAEDVSCTHGATVGDISDEQLFYLLSRGLDLTESKSLLIAAFYEETVGKIPFSDTIKAEISEKIRTQALGI